MPEEKSSKPSFLNRLLGVDPKEEKRKLEEVQRGLERIKALKAQIPDIVAAQVASLEAASRANLAKTKEELDRQYGHLPIPRDTVTDMKIILDAVKKGVDAKTAQNSGSITQWDDGFGNRIYLSPSVEAKQVPDVAAKISKQKGVFGGLGTEDQTRLKAEFGSSKGSAEGVKPFADYLSSSALEVRFQELFQLRRSQK